MKTRFIIFFFLSSGLALNAFGAVKSEETAFPVSSENRELINEFENTLINSDDRFLAFNQTQTEITGVNKAVGSNNYRGNNFSEKPKDFYFSFKGGVLNFPYVENIQTFSGAGGFGLGTSFLNSNVDAEISFIYSFQKAEIDRFVEIFFDDIDQYSFSATGIYHWDVSWPLIPIIGATASLTRRQYNYDENHSDAFDVGLVFGMDKPVDSELSFGLEYRYMVNVDYERNVKNSSYYNMRLQSWATKSEVNELESFDYQVVFLNAKMKF